MSETRRELRTRPTLVTSQEKSSGQQEPRPGEPGHARAESLWQRPVSLRILADVVKIAEIVVLWTSAYAAYRAVYGVGPLAPVAGHYVAMVMMGTFLWITAAHGAVRPTHQELLRLKSFLMAAACWGGIVLSLGGLVLVLNLVDALFREAMMLWFCGATLGLITCRAMAAGYIVFLRAKGLLRQRIVILGAGAVGTRLAHHIERSVDCNVTVAQVFDDAAGAVGTGRLGGPIGSFSDGLTYIRNQNIDCVVIALPFAKEAQILQLVCALRQMPVDVYIAADGVGKYSSKAPSIAGIPMLIGAERPLKEWRAVAKAVEDWVGASIALLVFLPLMLFIALAIKLDSRGPVFFRQPRLGFNQKIFHVYKFRTMYVADSDRLGDQLTRKGDKRITRLGNLLRKSSLDELPQLLNVLSGDMSIVGPRPHPLNAKAADKRYDEVVDGYAARHRMKPGITGWAQVNGWRGETDTYEKIEKRVEHDLTYIERWSVLFDLRIILRTAVHGFYHDNAF